MAIRRSLFALPVLCLSLALAGCENMDPAYWLPDTKKKLPGERREVFPEGIPGVVQGVPQELVKGNQAAEAESNAAAMAPQEAPAAAERPQPKQRARTKVVRPIQPPPQDAQPEQPAQPRQAAPRQAQPAASSGAWPSPQAAQQPQPQQQAPAASGWPAPPPAGTFTR